MTRRHCPKNKKAPASGGQLRIIGGQWRGTKLTITEAEGLRPTPARVRETLFNWLATDIHDARCLDLFAGTGALGLEALSRGARLCRFVEQSTSACRQLTAQFEKLAADSAELDNSNAINWLNGPVQESFDIVFIDPPYRQGLAQSSCELLLEKGWLSANAVIYLEMAGDELPPKTLQDWGLQRAKNAGQVCYRLYRRAE